MVIIMEMIKETKWWMKVVDQENHVGSLRMMYAEMEGIADSNILKYVTCGMSKEGARE